MSKLSIEKLNKFKREKCFTNKKISKEANIPIATVDRLFSGASKNPSITILQKMAELFECTVDDFIDYDTKYKRPRYLKKEIEKLILKISKNEGIIEIFGNLLSLEENDLNAIGQIVSRLAKK